MAWWFLQQNYFCLELLWLSGYFVLAVNFKIYFLLQWRMSLELCFGLREFVDGFLEIKIGYSLLSTLKGKKIQLGKITRRESWGTFSVYRFQRSLNLWKIINMKEHEKGIRMTERIILHKGRRGSAWDTGEEERMLPKRCIEEQAQPSSNLTEKRMNRIVNRLGT